MRNVQVCIRGTAGAPPAASDFELRDTELPQPGRGQALCRTRWLSLDPALRLLNGGAAAGPGMAGPLPALGVCEVLEARHDVLAAGDCVVLDCGMQALCVTNGTGAQRVHPGQTPASTALGVLGPPGLRAWHALEAGGYRAGETVLVTRAATTLGSMIGQIALVRGGRAIGIADSREQCDWLTQHARFAGCVDASAADPETQLRQLAPRGVSVAFVDGSDETLRALAARHLAADGRLVDVGRLGPGEEHRTAFLKQAIAWFGAHLIANREDVTAGLENAPAALARLARAGCFGQPLVKV